MIDIKNIGIIGTGGIADTHIQYLLQYSPSLKFHIASRDPDRAKQAANRVGTEPYSGTYDDLIADEKIDAFIIISPHNLHAEHLVKCLKTGKSTIIEKPVVCMFSELDSVLDGIKKNEYQPPFVAENASFFPRLKEAKRIKKINHIVSNHYYAVSPSGWRLEKEKMGGGSLIDGGIHTVRALRLLAGEVESVYALETGNNEMEGEAGVQLLLKFNSCITASMNYSWAHHGQPDTPEFLILGDGESLALNLRKKTSMHFKGTEQEMIKHLGRFGKVDLKYELGHSGCAKEMLSWASQEKRTAHWFAEGIKDLLVVEAAYRSMKTGNVSEVDKLPAWIEDLE